MAQGHGINSIFHVHVLSKFPVLMTGYANDPDPTLENETIEMRHALRPFLLTFLLLMSSTYVSTQTTSRTVSQSEQQVLSVETTRIAAMIQADTKQLNLVLAEDLTYTHSSGRTDTKAELLASITSGNLKYESIEPTETKVRLYGSTAVVTGQAKLKINNNGQPLSFGLKFTGVYTKHDGHWQLVAYQSTRLAP